jgi:nitrite reductase (NADH) large subunit
MPVATAAQTPSNEPDATAHDAPIVIVGSGPAGVRTAQELLRFNYRGRIVLCGAEAREPYNRVRLSSFLMGELGMEDLGADLRLPTAANVEQRLGCAIAAIDTAAQTVTDARGRVQHYSKLVLATGSSPHIPNIPNITLPGVFTFRDFNDAEKLFARRMRSRRTVVLGGGLLGLEAARAMRRFQTEVVVIEHDSRLMPRQLDTQAGSALRHHIEAMNIEVILSDGVRAVLGDQRITGVLLQSGRQVECDTVIVATGIRPNVDLALKAGIHIGRGIRIDDRACTSDPHVYAVGECAEHRDVVYGLLAPGFEQASVAARNMCGGTAQYTGTMAATKLKVVGLPVFSIGAVANEVRDNFCRQWTYRAPDNAQHVTKLITRSGRLIGAVAIGALPELNRIQEAVKHRRSLHFWQLWRFQRSGRLWREEAEQQVTAWPAATTVCNCTGVTRGQLSQAFASGCATVMQLSAATGAGTVCGSCKPLLNQLVGSSTPPEAVRGARPLLVFSAITAVGLLLHMMLGPIHFVTSVQQRSFDFLWLQSFWKQLSGYTLLGLSVLTLLLSLRKRWSRFTFGNFDVWRVVHVVVGALTVLALLAHTGARMGVNFNFALNGCFMALLFAGTLTSLAIAREHTQGAAGMVLRRRLLWAHIITFWPVPVLLGLHILQAYFF